MTSKATRTNDVTQWKVQDLVFRAEGADPGDFIAHDEQKCEGCGDCIDRCQMEALELDGDTVALNLDRCIGCGLCVTTCPTESLALVRKSESEQPDVPQNMIEASIKLGKARGKL